MARSNGSGSSDAAGAEREVDALYDLPLEEFVGARDALAKRLRQAGDRERAAAVKALRKPSVTAWAANRLARGERDLVDELLAAGDALRAAQRDVLAGDAGPDALARAAEAERRAVARLVARAGDVLGGASEATLQRLSDTLRAAATDDEARAELAAGRLTRERTASGLGGGLLGGMADDGGGRRAPRAPAPARSRASAERGPEPPAPGRARPETRPQPRPDAARQREKALEERRQAREKLKAAEQALRAARRDVAAAERRAGRVETELRRAREALERVEGRLDRLRARQD
jgi:hypothetical protein